jgi:hypothetical protein
MIFEIFNILINKLLSIKKVKLILTDLIYTLNLLEKDRKYRKNNQKKVRNYY